MRMISALLLFFAFCTLGMAEDIPHLKKFVAPAYPRAAKSARIEGTTKFRLTVGAHGEVKTVELINGYPILAQYSKSALEQWSFEASSGEHILDVTVHFEFLTDKCEGTNVNPIPSETEVSANLPDEVFVRTGLQCVETSVW